MNKALTAKQERRLRDYLEDRFLDINRDYNKRAELTTSLPTLSSYLNETHKLLALILQIPPIEPSSSLRTSLLLHYTHETLTSIVGYETHFTASNQQAGSSLSELITFLRSLDSAWVSVLSSHSGVSTTDETRLKSLLLSTGESVAEWLGDGVLEMSSMDAGLGGDEETTVGDVFNEIFVSSVEMLGGFEGVLLDDEEDEMECVASVDDME